MEVQQPGLYTITAAIPAPYRGITQPLIRHVYCLLSAFLSCG
jgi:hypothetical protein